MGAGRFLFGHLGEIVSMDKPNFGAFICMAMEEWCRANDESAVDFAEELAALVKEVNADLGRY